MAVQLEIEDGPPPHYMSPNIQVVLPDTPDIEVDPVSGTPCLMRAIVRNNGTDAVQSAVVRFYWCNPLLCIDRTTAVLVGSAFLSLNPGETDTALCLVPWQPVFVNNGHECLFAEAFHPNLDPLPPGPAFDVVGDRHVAQRNVIVLNTPSPQFHVAFEAANPWTVEREFAIRAVQAPLELLRKMGNFGERRRVPQQEGRVQDLAFAATPCPDDRERSRARRQIDRLTLPPLRRAGFSLIGSIEGPAALVLVEQLVDDRPVGGLVVVIVNQA